MIHIEGTRENRTLEQARARIPMTSAQVRSVIDEMEAKTKSKAARIAVAKGALRVGNVSTEGKDVYREYLLRLEA